VQISAGKSEGNYILPPALPVNKSVRAFTTFQMDEFRQIASRYFALKSFTMQKMHFAYSGSAE